MALRLNLNALIDRLKVGNQEAITQSEFEAGSIFVSLWPKEMGALNKFRQQPTCSSCRHSLLDVLSLDVGRTTAFAQRLFPGKEIQLDMGGSSASRMSGGQALPKSIVGQVRDIEDTPEAYDRLLNEVRVAGGRYQGLTVRALVPGTIRIYFY